MYLMHIEKIWDNNVWRNLLDFIEKHKKNCHLFLMAPEMDYQRSVMGFRGTATELKKILAERYEKLRQLSLIFHFRIGLHFHLTLFPESLSTKEKSRQFEKAYYFLMDIFGEVDGVAFGWFIFDKFTKNLCENRGIPICHGKLFSIVCHDYNLPLTSMKKTEYLLRGIVRLITKTNI